MAQERMQCGQFGSREKLKQNRLGRGVWPWLLVTRTAESPVES